MHLGWAQGRKPFGYQRAWSLTFKDLSKFGYLKRIDLLLYVNYKARGRYWVLDSGCTQHMTGDARIFNSINTNGTDGYDSITFGDNGKGKVKGLVRLQYPMT